MFENHCRIALGCMGLTGTWNPADMNAEREARAVRAFEAAMEAGITLYDHADIYGGGTCEEVFKACLKAVPEARERIQIWTKGSIGNGRYNLSAPYIREAIDNSLRRLGIDYIDLYQLHRPDPLAHPAETAGALREAIDAGKIRAVGVSNYFPEQVRALLAYLDVPLVSNQIEISLLKLEPFYEGWKLGAKGATEQGDVGDGTLDQCMALDIVPLAWSPLGQGRLARPSEEGTREARVNAELETIAQARGATPTQIALAWLLTHPSGIIPIVGSANPDHIREAAAASEMRLERDEWYRLFTASWGRRVP